MPKTLIAPVISAPSSAAVIWNYYKEHKPLLLDEIREYRDRILSQLMLGRDAADVFSDY